MFEHSQPPPSNMTVTLPFVELWQATVDAQETFARLRQENARLKQVIQNLRDDKMIAERIDSLKAEKAALREQIEQCR